MLSLNHKMFILKLLKYVIHIAKGKKKSLALCFLRKVDLTNQILSFKCVINCS